MTDPAVLIGGPSDGKNVTAAPDTNTITTAFVKPEIVIHAAPRPSRWRHPIRYRRWTPPPLPEPPKMIQLRYAADGTIADGRRVFRLASAWQPYRGPVISEDGDLYAALVNAMYAVHPMLRQDPATRWVMNLAWWKRVRREAERKVGLDDADEETWEPSPDDCLLGTRITVTDDGGAPHLENPRYPAGWPS